MMAFLHVASFSPTFFKVNPLPTFSRPSDAEELLPRRETNDTPPPLQW